MRFLALLFVSGIWAFLAQAQTNPNVIPAKPHITSQSQTSTSCTGDDPSDPCGQKPPSACTGNPASDPCGAMKKKKAQSTPDANAQALTVDQPEGGDATIIEIGPDLAKPEALAAGTIFSSSLSSISLQRFERKLPDSNPVFPCNSFKCIEKLNLDDDKSLSGPAKRDVVDNRQTDKKARPRFYKDKAFMTSSLLVYAAAGFDIHETMREKWFWSYNHPPQKASAHFVDSDPVARPIVDLPNPAYLAVSVAMATGLNWLSWKMKHSRRFRRVWWLPQVITIQNNIWGGLNCEVDTNDNIDWLKQLNGWKTLPPAIPNTKH